VPKNESIKKVLVIGSGPIIIGQAAEFDYAGTQACRLLRSEGVSAVLVNSNPATIMTDGDMADSVYLEPLNIDTLKRIILKEKPDSLLAGIGGQTGLTLAMQLSKSGFLTENGVRLIGTTAEAIDKSEDRQLFKDAMARIGQPTIPSDTVHDVDAALRTARKIGYPVIVRPAFTLGGSGGGIAFDDDALRTVAATGLDASPIRQVLVEKYIFGWKEIEFEVMRDGAGNAITVCSMENVDPVGIHTGDSIVVAPALTLADREYQMLRSAALAIIAEMGIEGGCNCQFALNPDSFDYAVIEVNPRVSRSSALASKATGYPIAKVAAKIALGYTLDEIKNDVTGETFACFEPALDYVVVKYPKWPFDKFSGSSRELGPQMKATGEVMAIGQTFEAALMKAVRGAEIKQDTLNRAPNDRRPLHERLRTKDDLRLFTIFEALKSGWNVDEIHGITRIDRWFIEKVKNLANYEAEISRAGLTYDSYCRGKRLGYTDAALSRFSQSSIVKRLSPSYKMVDTCAGEFVAKTPYFYSAFGGRCDARAHLKEGRRNTIVVLGSGPIRIGQGIEFDYSSVHCVRTLKELGYEVVIINNNPETVSTDYDTADRLYFEPLCPEDVMGVIEVERPIGVVVAFGGQTAISLADFLVNQGITILGTSAAGIDTAEDRGKFDRLLGTLGIKRPRGLAVHSVHDAEKAAENIGFPVLVRPSYVIGGQNMVIAHDGWDVRRYASVILSGDADNSVLIDKYMPGKELEADVISDGTDVLIPGIMEHIERAGIHSGDSIAVYPPFGLSPEMLATVVDRSEKLALALGTKGLVNIQYLVYDDELYVIEVNPRASRTIPYLSKITGIPMTDIATKVMMGATLRSLGYRPGLCPEPPYYGVKAPVFSFEKLPDANSLLGPEMKSTGEVLGIARTRNEAIYKALRAAGYNCCLSPGREKKGVLLSLDNRQFSDLPKLAAALDALGLRIFATPDTAAAVKALGIYAFDIGPVCSIAELRPLMEKTGIILVIYTGALHDDTMGDYLKLHGHAVRLGIPCITSVDTALAVVDIMASGLTDEKTELIDINSIVTPQCGNSKNLG
jgi:carbamoyl-phosphate synthase large subunit